MSNHGTQASMRARLLLRTCALGLLTGAAGLAPGLARAADAKDISTIEELIVTAQKREESIQRVAAHVIAYTSEELQARGVSRVEDLALQTPSMSVGGYDGPSGQARVSLRGIGTGVPGIGVDPNVGIYLDGVYTPQLQTILTDFIDVDHAEILMGPQGTLYGRNATGGVVNIISKRPDATKSAGADAEVESYARVRVRGYLNGAITDNLFARASVIRSTGDSFTRNLSTGGRPKAVDALGGHLALRWVPTDAITVDLGADYLQDDATGSFSVKPVNITGTALFLPTAKALGIVPAGQPVLSSDPYEVRNNTPAFGKIINRGIRGEINIDLPKDYKFTALAGHRLTTDQHRFDSDGTEIDLIDSNYALRSESESVEFRLTSPQGDRFNWLGGFYYYKEDASSILNTLFPVTNATFLRIGLGALTPARSLYNSAITTEATAVFVDGSYWLTPDRLRLHLGARQSWETKDHRTAGSSFSAAAPAALNLSSGSKSWQDFSPRIGLDYFVNPSIMIYGLAAQGFKSGGFNSYGNAPPFLPEKLTDYEVGIKSTLMEGRLRLNADIFYYDYQNLQFAVNIPGQPFAVNNINAKVQGAEIEITAAPSRELIFTLNAAAINSKTSSGDRLYDGNELPITPQFKGSATVSYTIPVKDWAEFALRADYAYQTKSQGDLLNSPNPRTAPGSFNPDLQHEARGVLNGSVSLQAPDQRWRVTVFGRNLTEEVYSLFNYGLNGLGQWKVLGAPRTFGLQLSAKY